MATMEWLKDPVYVRWVIGHADESIASTHHDQLDFTNYKSAKWFDPEMEARWAFSRGCAFRRKILSSAAQFPSSRPNTQK